MPTQKQITLARKLLLFMENPEKDVSAELLKSLFKGHLDTYSRRPEFMVELGWVKHLLKLYRAENMGEVRPEHRKMLVVSLVRRRTTGVWEPPRILVKSKQA
jgi:hypothetical protein